VVHLKKLICAAAVLAVSTAHAGVVIHVDATNCPGPGDGSEAEPYCSIQTAIDNAVATDEIVVAPGTYNEVINFLGKAVWLRSSDGPEVTVISADGPRGADTAVTCTSGEQADTILDGFTLTDGTGTLVEVFPDFVRDVGGGIYISSSSPTVTNCTFIGNIADDGGGGMSSFNSSSTVTDCTFTGNMADLGGGLHSDVGTLTVNDSAFQGNVAVGGSQPGGGGVFTINTDAMLMNCTLNGNSADRGGALCSVNMNLTVINCVIDQNSAPGPPGAGGGGVWVQNADALFLDCELRDNTSTAAAGAIIALSSGANPAQVTMVGCSITGNSAEFAGGLAVQDALAFMFNCTIAGNQALDDQGNVAGGGGVWALDLSHVREAAGLFMVNVLIVGNSTAARGGGVYAEAEFTLTNCTISGNTAAESGGGIDAAHEGACGTVNNSILWGNTPDQLLDGDGATTVVRYSDIQGRGFGETNIDADPMFVDSDNGDFRLQAGSPCIDAGHNWAIAGITEIDLDGNPRFAADELDFDPGCGVPVVVDMGAYEFQGDPFPVKFGDINGDGVVGIADFLDLLAAWGACIEDCCLADLDLDGDVGITDFLLLLANWG